MNNSLLLGPFPTGRTVVEASAGTGKTYTITGLAVRAIAEKRCTTDRLAVVTFSREATRELRSRLLQALITGRNLLTVELNGEPQDRSDTLAQALVLNGESVYPNDELRRRQRRLEDAVNSFDSIRIDTIHSWCKGILTSLGGAPTGRLLGDLGVHIADVSNDLSLQAVMHHDTPAKLLPWNPAKYVRHGFENQAATVRPTAGLTQYHAVRSWFVERGSNDVPLKLHREGIRTFDDLIDDTYEQLQDPATALSLAQQIDLALVDEFQDTDQKQWAIIEALFPANNVINGVPLNPDRALVLVGDPKQSIYGWRGADIETYKRVRDELTGDNPVSRLDMNYRSSKQIVDAITTLFAGTPLGHGITVVDVAANTSDRLSSITFRTVRDDAPLQTNRNGFQVDAARDFVASDVARQTVQLLTGDTAFQPSEIAVLVRTRHQGQLIFDKLTESDVPTVLQGIGHVLTTPAATAWLALLRSIAAPTDTSVAKEAALHPLIGWDEAHLVTADDVDIDTLHQQLHDWKTTFHQDGVAALYRQVAEETSLYRRLLRQPDGRRLVVDLEHLTDLLSDRQHANPEAPLHLWLEDQIARSARQDADENEQTTARRLDQGSDAVRVMTIHQAKGLEFPVVLTPFLWNMSSLPRETVTFTQGRERITLSADRSKHGGDWNQAVQQHEYEELRLAYVAMTRAKTRLLTWWVPGNVDRNPLSWLLSTADENVTTTESAQSRLDDLAITCKVEHQEISGEEPIGRFAPSDVATITLPVALSRTIDHVWRRTSYSGLLSTAEEHTAQHGSLRQDVNDAAFAYPVDGNCENPILSETVPLAEIRGGADVGTAVHAALEHLDFNGGDLDDAANAAVHRYAKRSGLGLDAESLDAVSAGVCSALRTPWGLLGNNDLTTVTRHNRIDELAFEFPIRPEPNQADVLVTQLADVWERYTTDDDPFIGYPEKLRRTFSGIAVRGYLSGFIDLIVRTPQNRFIVADYKTNRIAPADEAPTYAHFTRQAMATEMSTHHYPLQAMFYTVAVHRYLRWRLPSYSPSEHLGGVAYLFIRGMNGPDTPVVDGTTCGVLEWRPSTELVLAVDSLLAGDQR